VSETKGYKIIVKNKKKKGESGKRCGLIKFCDGLGILGKLTLATLYIIFRLSVWFLVVPRVDTRAEPMDLSPAPKPVSSSQNVLRSRQTTWNSKTGELVAIITKRNSIRAERSDSKTIVSYSQ
jgi:hypothetical protein